LRIENRSPHPSPTAIELAGIDESNPKLEIRNNSKIQKEENHTAGSAGDRGAANANPMGPDQCGSFENRKIDSVR
jgi:hypothetical protein